jgi:hypothetical protein
VDRQHSGVHPPGGLPSHCSPGSSTPLPHSDPGCPATPPAACPAVPAAARSGSPADPSCPEAGLPATPVPDVPLGGWEVSDS